MPRSRSRRRYAYQAYGLSVRSVIPLPCRRVAGCGRVDAEVVRAPASLFPRVHRTIGGERNDVSWFRYASLDDGSCYLRWSGLFEFVISADGRRIAGRSLDGGSVEAFQTYLLGQVLSFALLKQGIDSLHATVVVVDGKAVAFVGDCGYGKSSLGAAFLQAGHSLLTDDLLVVEENGHSFRAWPGPPRIKLFPEVAKRVFGDGVVGTPMNPLTPKLVIRLAWKMSWLGAAPLKAIYVLTPPAQNTRRARVTIRPLAPRQAFLALLKNTFNAVIVEPERLARQFDLTARLVARIPVRLLAFPRDLARLPAVRAALESDLRRF
ncbi:MAG: hypothetical protein HY726_19995 [Candidatus Rokubacteria bacterium]|nr:hypothetical protein [Candidatus Rokubacteria bacterium]